LRVIICLCLYLSLFELHAQETLRVDTFLNPVRLIEETLLDGETDLGIEKVQYTGPPECLGRFSNKLARDFPKAGIILSTGNVFDAVGPNRKSNTSTNTHGKSDWELARMANNISMDASVLSFQFEPHSDSIRFNFVFASEEYPEYVFRGVNDVFAFFLIDLETKQKRNLALVPNTNSVVSIDNINFKNNSKYYIENKYWYSRRVDYWQQNKREAEISYLIEFDGFTKSLEAHAAVVAGRRYELRIAISDIGDALYDSAVFLEAGSFTDKKRPSKQEKENMSSIFEGNEVVQEGDTSLVYLSIQFEFDSYDIPNSSVDDIEKLKNFLESNADKKLEIVGHTDDRGSADYNLILSEKRAQSVLNSLTKLGVSATRLSAKGDGSSKPYTEEKTEEGRSLNRRVEFRIY